MNTSAFDLAVEEATGMSISFIMKTPVDQLRKKIEEKHHGQSMRLESRFPLIGRGNVLRSRLVSHAEIEADMDRLLK